jgi:hypothetical protein
MNPRDKISRTLAAARGRHATFRKRDVRVLIEVMKEAGLSVRRVEVDADGKISAVHGPPDTSPPAEMPPERHPWDE